MWKLRRELILGKPMYVVRNVRDVHGYGFSNIHLALEHIIRNS